MGNTFFAKSRSRRRLEDGSNMLAAARLSGTAHMVDFEFPEVPAWRQAKHILDSGQLGQLTHVVVSWQVELMPPVWLAHMEN